MDEEYLPILSKQNVWWEGRIENDVHLGQWRAHRRHWTPFQLDALPLEPFALNFVIGPRQAGKTTLLKCAVEKLLKRGEPPHSIFYLRCDEIADGATLRDIFKTVSAENHGDRQFIFLDEVTEVDGWEKTVKGLADDGDLKNAVVTVSGSNAFQLQKGAELFPGRRGHGKDVTVLPLSFQEYVRVADPKLGARLPTLTTLAAAIKEAQKLSALQPALQKHLLNYFQCGGFPLAVLAYLADGAVSESAKDAYKSWLIGDVLKNGRSDSLARAILKVILSKAPSPLSWEAIAQETPIRSPPTVASYVELLERLFVILPLYAVNPHTKSNDWAKNKKLHLLDPLLYHLAEEWSLHSLTHKTEVMAEAALAVHVARFLARTGGTRRLSERISYWKNGYEIDAVAHTSEGLLGFEMKWTDRAAAFATKIGPIKNSIYVSKNTLKEKPAVIPLALLLAML